MHSKVGGGSIGSWAAAAGGLPGVCADSARITPTWVLRQGPARPQGDGHFYLHMLIVLALLSVSKEGVSCAVYLWLSGRELVCLVYRCQ